MVGQVIRLNIDWKSMRADIRLKGRRTINHVDLIGLFPGVQMQTSLLTLSEARTHLCARMSASHYKYKQSYLPSQLA